MMKNKNKTKKKFTRFKLIYSTNEDDDHHIVIYAKKKNKK